MYVYDVMECMCMYYHQKFTTVNLLMFTKHNHTQQRTNTLSHTSNSTFILISFNQSL